MASGNLLVYPCSCCTPRVQDLRLIGDSCSAISLHYPWPAFYSLRVRPTLAPGPLPFTRHSIFHCPRFPRALGTLKVCAIWGPRGVRTQRIVHTGSGSLMQRRQVSRTTASGGSRRLRPALVVRHRLHWNCPWAGLSDTLTQERLFSFFVRPSLGHPTEEGIS